MAERSELAPKLRSRIILGKPGSGKTTTLFQQLELARPENLLVVERDLRESSQIEGLLDHAAGGAGIVFDDVQDNLEAFRDLCLALLARAAIRAEARSALMGVYRELGVRGELAIALGVSARHHRRLAEEEGNVNTERNRLVESWEAIWEAVALFRNIGDSLY